MFFFNGWIVRVALGGSAAAGFCLSRDKTLKGRQLFLTKTLGGDKKLTGVSYTLD